ncbi:MAG: tRNA (N6-threonylcarbamoyladenosine(37)-N6)-methyltransferase TrmO [Chloroflexi bacterium]|nr:tRNA (N6-threonylcarbamoyladenosine(37)-N6)-methyltransferase TrmO [Chloroflexota bacterium]MCL5110950.1 tRNA (N6-threonylcarbamoyladenosine(37)-N6)-methyltransferase TrmO [Chloroflexota bacterium]
MSITLRPIGEVRSPITEAVDEGWGDVVAEVVVEPALAGGLRGLEQFSHAVVVFYMHQAAFRPETDLLRRPRGREDLPLTGSFAQRAKHRPNPIGITAVEIVSVADNALRVKGLDAVDGTPVLDVKPYFPHFDHVDNALLPRWVEEIMAGYF